MPIDRLRDVRGAVSHQTRYLFDRDPAVRHQRHEGVPQLTRCPGRAYSREARDPPEHLAHGPRVLRVAELSREYEADLRPFLTGNEPVALLLPLLCPQRLTGDLRKPEAAP